MSNPSLPRRRLRWTVNPVVVKELRSRMRGGRAFLLLTGFLAALCAIGYGLFQLGTSRERFGLPLFSAQIGQTLFAGLAFTLLFLVCIIAPAVTVNAISSERERLTYEMLVATPLPAWRLLWGKLIASLTYVGLLLVAAVPLGSIVYLFGGITLKHVLQALAIIVMTAITAGMIGIWASALAGRTGRAAVLAYLLIAGIIGGLLFSSYVWQARRDEAVPYAMLTPNPVSALASSVAALSGPSIDPSSGMIGGFPGQGFPGKGVPWIDTSQWGGLYVPGWQILSIGIYPPIDQDMLMGAVAFEAPEARSVWRTTLVIEILTCLALFWMTLHLVRPRRRWRITRGDALMLLVSVLTLAGLSVWRGWV